MIQSTLRSAKAYATVDVQSRADGNGPHEVVLLLFEGLLERIQLSRLAMEQNDLGNKVRHLNRALQILSEGLRTHLDLKAGGELAQHLDGLYAYCSVRLLHANAHNDAAALDEVYGLLKPVADAWREIRPAVTGGGAHLGTTDAPASQRGAVAALAGSQRPVGVGAYPPTP